MTGKKQNETVPTLQIESAPIPETKRKDKEPNPYQAHGDLCVKKMNDPDDLNRAIMFPALTDADGNAHTDKYVVRKLREYARDNNVTIHTRYNEDTKKFTAWATEKITRARKSGK